jgi:hypothetical protein
MREVASAMMFDGFVNFLLAAPGDVAVRPAMA